MESISEHSNTFVALVFLLAVVMLFLRWSQRNMKASAARIKKMERPRPEAPRLSHNLDAPASLARAEVQMHDLARDLSGQLDAKIAIVNRLIRTAEEHIVRLERAIERAAAQRLIEPESGAPAPPRRETMVTQRGNSSAGSGTARQASAGSVETQAAGKQERYRAIYELADAGYTSHDIAPRVGTPVGEIELILSLRGSSQSV